MSAGEKGRARPTVAERVCYPSDGCRRPPARRVPVAGPSVSSVSSGRGVAAFDRSPRPRPSLRRDPVRTLVPGEKRRRSRRADVARSRAIRRKNRTDEYRIVTRSRRGPERPATVCDSAASDGRTRATQETTERSRSARNRVISPPVITRGRSFSGCGFSASVRDNRKVSPA